ncbi:MAG: DNA-binding transcriptional MerR regulator [Dinoroseobacter sp.]|jgi:DNA-binding transcriptional MerR regulator
MTTAFSIRDLAQEFSVTTRTLRFYEEKGLLQPSRNKQTRSYSNADRTRLRLILRGKRLGLSLEESSDIILMYNSTSGNQQQVEHLLVKIREKRQQLLQQQEDLKLMLADLKDSEARCLAALNLTEP